jgi:ELWxxDGT repeat protein
LVEDLYVGSNGSNPQYPTEYQGALYFAANANDGGAALGKELYKYDGSEVTLVADINQGAGWSNPGNQTGFIEYGGDLFFSARANDGVDRGYELHKYDGISVTMVADLNVGGHASPRNLTEFDGKLYFTANGNDGTDAIGVEFYVYDGTNVALVADINQGTGSSNADNLTLFDDAIYFAAYGDDGTTEVGYELYKYDGVDVTLVADLIPGVTGSDPDDLTVFQDALYFTANGYDGTDYVGRELFKFDGTEVTLVADIMPGSGDSDPGELLATNDLLVFTATTDAGGTEVFAYDGAGVSQYEINTGSLGYNPNEFLLVDDSALII